MENEKRFYIKYPFRNYYIYIFILLCQPILVILFEVLVGTTIFIIIWVNLVVLFFGYNLFKMLLVNKFNHSYFQFNKEGIIGVNPFNRIYKYYWNDYNGYILIDNILMIQFKNKNIKIINDFLKNGNINDIIKIIEEYKIDIEYNN
ncbi:MAG: hypothetical protein FWD47_05395 [Treponema sp.]|nr:hypothetical protein [Treponema sp.]